MMWFFRVFIGISIMGVGLLSADIYEGVLGKYPIRMLLSDDAPYEGKYTYKGKLLSIPLEGESLGALCEPIWHEKEGVFKPSACFSGELKGDVFSGKWQKVGSKKSLSFKLMRLVVPKVEDTYGESYNDELFYNELLLKEMKFKKLSSVHRDKGLTFIPYIEPITKVMRRQIVLENKGVEKRINKTLKKLHRSDVLTSLECIDRGYIQKENGTGESVMTQGGDIQVEYHQSPFLTLSYRGSLFCGGAHPNNYYNRYVFDTRTGEEIQFDEIVSLYNTDENNEESISPAFQTFLERYVLKQNEEAEGCYGTEDIHNYFLLYPTKDKKMAIYLSGMGHASFVCETEPIALVPMEKLTPFILPQYRAYFKALIKSDKLP